MKLTTVLLITIALLAVPAVASVPLSAGIYDDSSILLAYTGTWSDVVSGFGFGNAYKTASAVSSSVEFDLYAEGFTVYYVSDITYGSLSVCVDSDCTVINQNAGTARASATFTGLASGSKLVSIAPSADGTPVSFDAIYIHPSGQEVNANIIESPFEYNSQSYTGIYDLTLTAGDVSIVLMLVLVALMQIAQFIHNLRSER